MNVEANLVTKLGKSSILPVAIGYQTQLAANVAALKGAGVEADTGLLAEVSAEITKLKAGLATLADARIGSRG